MTSRMLTCAIALALTMSAPAWAHDYSTMDCTAKDFAKAFQDGMNDTPQMKQNKVKITDITDVENVEATADHLVCRGTFSFASGETLDEIFSIKDGADGHMNLSFKADK
jgi:ribulose-5-phosphate 4-epimerase/fuculose-1-phosphate aldolase